MNTNNMTGSASVDSMLTLNIQGNMIPFAWYQTILRENGKPHLLAIIILSDLVYWFRPVEIREEETGRFLGWRKRFRSDLLQKSYQNYAELLGESRRSVKAAMDVLEKIGVIRREFRDIQTSGGMLNNVMFIDLNVDVLKQLTYPEMQESEPSTEESDGDSVYEENAADTPPAKFCGRVVQNSVRGSYKVSGEAPAKFCRTNTENTTEITTESIRSIYPDDGGSEEPVQEDRRDGLDEAVIAGKYMELIRENICYDALMQTDNISDRKVYEELYLMICDVVCQKKKTIRIGGEDLPHEVVKSRFLKLNMEHLQYAAYAVQNTATKIGNMRAYLLTTLYHAPTTMTSYWSQKANHDMHAGIWLETTE